MVSYIQTCECHKIDWSGGPGYYKYQNKPLDQLSSIDCLSKVNSGIMDYCDYYRICKYIPYKPNTKFPNEVLDSK